MSLRIAKGEANENVTNGKVAQAGIRSVLQRIVGKQEVILGKAGIIPVKYAVFDVIPRVVILGKAGIAPVENAVLYVIPSVIVFDKPRI